MQEELGRELHRAREKAGLSLDAVAETAKISGAYLHKLEHGVVENPSPRVLARVASALEVPYLRLMELAGYLSDAEAARVRKRRPSPRPHPLSGKELSRREWREVGAFIETLIAKRQKAG
jgi:HTH-type transcriptional regulator, competence development regulator